MSTVASAPKKRWLIALGAILVQLGVGSFYTWSLFNQPLASKLGIPVSTIAVTFSIGTLALAVGAVFGGSLQEKIGARTIIAIAGILLGAGLVLTSLVHSLLVLYLLAGVLVGLGDGAGYMTSLSTAIKWFPDRKGLMSGISIGCYGLGSLIFKYINGGLLKTGGLGGAFVYWGIIAFILVFGGALLFKNAPANIEELTQTKDTKVQSASAARNFTLSEMLRTWQVYLLTFILFTACMGGVYMIGVVKDIGVQMAGLTSGVAANAVAIVAIFNTLGRLILGPLSDRANRVRVISCTLAVTALAAFVLSFAHLNYPVFLTSVALVAFCFGGNITIFPTIIAEYFGLEHHGGNYGIVYLVGFGFGPLVGTLVAAALANFKPTFILIGALCIIAILLSLVVKMPSKTSFTGKQVKDDGRLSSAS